MIKTILICLTGLVSVSSFAQGHFSAAFAGNGQDHMNLYILTATINGVNLEAGDEIAAFDGTICCGKAVLAQPVTISNMSSFVTIAASKADNGYLNGFTEGNAISYKFWDASKNEEVSGITAEYRNISTAQTTTAPTYTANKSAFVLLSGKVNQIPVANAGTDQSVNEGTAVTLNGSASSDADGNTLTYLWTVPSGITLSSTTAASPTFTAPEVSTDTQYTFTLVVNDGKVKSTADQVIITVKRINNVPVANAGTDQSVNEGTAVTLNGSASSDADGNTLTYLWTVPSGITLSSTTAASPTFTAPEVSADTQYTFNLVVKDGTASSSADQVIITVKQVNKVPVANAGTDQTVNKGTIVTLNGLASADADKDPLTYIWTTPTGITLSSTSEVMPTFTAPAVTTNTQYAFSLVVNDGKSYSQADVTIVTVLAPVAIQVYPNPMTSGFQVAGLEGTGTLTMTNLRGKLCLKTQVTANQYISVRTLTKGYYILKLVYTNGTYECKVLKK